MAGLHLQDLGSAPHRQDHGEWKAACQVPGTTRLQKAGSQDGAAVASSKGVVISHPDHGLLTCDQSFGQAAQRGTAFPTPRPGRAWSLSALGAVRERQTVQAEHNGPERVQAWWSCHAFYAFCFVETACTYGRCAPGTPGPAAYDTLTATRGTIKRMPVGLLVSVTALLLEGVLVGRFAGLLHARTTTRDSRDFSRVHCSTSSGYHSCLPAARLLHCECATVKQGRRITAVPTRCQQSQLLSLQPVTAV